MGDHTEGSHRQDYRFRTEFPAELQADGKTVGCEAQNVSRSGVLLVGDFPAPEARIVDFALRAPTGRLTVSLKGRVIRVEPNPAGEGLRMALEYVEMDQSRRDALELVVARILAAPPPGPFDGLKPGATPPEIRKVLEAIPLPQRINLALRALLKEREFLRSDTHPAVLESLARNPNLSLVEARVLATSAYLMSGTLDVLSNELRFKEDEELRMAIAVHPRVSLGTAERVTADLKAQEIRKLLAKPGLNQLLREKLIRRSTQR